MATTKVKKLSNGYSYKYTDLATIHEELEQQGITYSQEIKYNAEAGADYIWTTLRYDEGTGNEKPICGCRVITGKLQGGNPAQEQGSALTYARRYSLLMALGWACEDDDAQSVGKTPEKTYADKPASGGRLDFEKVKDRLLEIDNVGEVMAAKIKLLAQYPRISEKQKAAINRIFSERCDQITEEGKPSHWHEAKAM